MTRRDNGAAAENFARKFMRAESSFADAYDMSTKNVLYEVKSCDAFVKSGSGSKAGYQLGRFAINAVNHAELKRISEEHHKRAAYVFIVRIRGHSIFRTMTWDEVESLLPMKTIDAHIVWSLVFR